MSFFMNRSTASKKKKQTSTPNKGKATRLKTHAASHVNCNDLDKAFIILTAFLSLQSCPYQLAKDSFKAFSFQILKAPNQLNQAKPTRAQLSINSSFFFIDRGKNKLLRKQQQKRMTTVIPKECVTTKQMPEIKVTSNVPIDQFVRKAVCRATFRVFLIANTLAFALGQAFLVYTDAFWDYPSYLTTLG